MADQWHWIITLMRPAPRGPLIETLHGVIDIEGHTRQTAYEAILEGARSRLGNQEESVATTFFSLEPNALGASTEGSTS